MSVMPRRWFAAALFALLSLPAFAGAQTQEAGAREAASSTVAIAADATRYLALGGQHRIGLQGPAGDQRVP